jgi:hypothetical protein
VAKFARINVRGILAKPEIAADILKLESSLMAKELADLGAERMREYIQQRGTRFSSAAQSAGINRGPGRIRTGNMYDSVDSRVESGNSRTLAAFGWLKNFEEYFGYQELGFRNIWIAAYSSSGRLLSGPNTPVSNGPIVRKNPFGGYKKTPGMFALRDARADVDQATPKFAKKYRSRITRKMNQL